MSPDLNLELLCPSPASRMHRTLLLLYGLRLGGLLSPSGRKLLPTAETQVVSTRSTVGLLEHCRSCAKFILTSTHLVALTHRRSQSDVKIHQSRVVQPMKPSVESAYICTQDETMLPSSLYVIGCCSCDIVGLRFRTRAADRLAYLFADYFRSKDVEYARLSLPRTTTSLLR